jgi:hypothetical protein
MTQPAATTTTTPSNKLRLLRAFGAVFKHPLPRLAPPFVGHPLSALLGQ